MIKISNADSTGMIQISIANSAWNDSNLDLHIALGKIQISIADSARNDSNLDFRYHLE